MAEQGLVFVSYSREDQDYVTELVRWLEGHGVSIWYDHDIDYGVTWESEIEDRLDAANAVVAVMSTSARVSSWVDRELAAAEQQGIPILPLLLEHDGSIARIEDLQLENVIGERMPGLSFCQKLPGFLVSEADLGDALSEAQRTIAQRIAASAGPIGPGSKGPGVAALQVELHRVGLDPGPIDGVCSDVTTAAIVEFQRRRCHVPTADGRVGPLTWAILVHSSLGDLEPAPKHANATGSASAD